MPSEFVAPPMTPAARPTKVYAKVPINSAKKAFPLNMIDFSSSK
jgi:hypothetical protein